MKTADVMNRSLLSVNTEITLKHYNKRVNITAETCELKERDVCRDQSESSSRVKPVAESQWVRSRTGNTGLSSVSLRVESGSPGWPHRSQSPPSSTGLQGASGCCSSCSGRPSAAPRGSCSPPSCCCCCCCCCRPPSRPDSSLRGSPCWPDTRAWPSPAAAPPRWRGAAPSGWDGRHLGDTNQMRGQGPHSRHLDTFTVWEWIFSFKDFLSDVVSAPPVTHSHTVSLPFNLLTVRGCAQTFWGAVAQSVFLHTRVTNVPTPRIRGYSSSLHWFMTINIQTNISRYFQEIHNVGATLVQNSRKILNHNISPKEVITCF